MFSVLSIKSQGIFLSSNEVYESNSEDEHYEEVEENYGVLDDGIDLDKSIIDEYDELDDEMDNDISESEDSDNIDHLIIVDEIEAEHYDSLDDE